MQSTERQEKMFMHPLARGLDLHVEPTLVSVVATAPSPEPSSHPLDLTACEFFYTLEGASRTGEANELGKLAVSAEEAGSRTLEIAVDSGDPIRVTVDSDEWDTLVKLGQRV